MFHCHHFVSTAFILSLFWTVGTSASEEISVKRLSQLHYWRQIPYRPHLASNKKGQAAVIWKHRFSRAVWVSTFNGKSWGTAALINEKTHQPIQTMKAEWSHRNPQPPVRTYRNEPPPPEIYGPPPSPENTKYPKPYPLLRPQVSLSDDGAITVAWLQAQPGTDKVYLWVNHKSWDAREWPKPIKAAFVAQFKKEKKGYYIYWNEYASFKLLPLVENRIRVIYARSVHDKCTTHFFYKQIPIKAFSSNFEEESRPRPLYKRSLVLSAGTQWDAASDAKGNISLVWSEGDWQGSAGAAWGSIYDSGTKKWTRPTLIQPDNEEAGPWTNHIQTQLVEGYAVATWTWKDEYKRKTILMGNAYSFEKKAWQDPSYLSDGVKNSVERPLLATNGKTVALGFTERWMGEKTGWKNRSTVWGRLFKKGSWQKLARCKDLGSDLLLDSIALNENGTLFASGASFVGKYRKNLWAIKADTIDKLEWFYPEILSGSDMVSQQTKETLKAEGKKRLTPRIGRWEFNQTTWEYTQFDIQIIPGRKDQATLAWTSRLHLRNIEKESNKYDLAWFHLIHTAQLR